MTAYLQELLAFAAVSGSAAWLAVSWWRRRAQGRCDGCSPRSTLARTNGSAVRPSALRVLR